MSELPNVVPSTTHVLTADEAPRRCDPAVWASALSLDDYIAQATELQPLWESTRRIAQIDEATREAAAKLDGPLSLLVLTEDWCGDAIHTLPFVQRLVEANPRLTMRLLKRDAHDAVMDAHRSAGARSIPVVIVYDADGRECGWWGPRPSVLQAWVKRDAAEMDVKERWRAIRTWYARDRGVSCAREVLLLLQHADQVSA